MPYIKLSEEERKKARKEALEKALASRRENSANIGPRAPITLPRSLIDVIKRESKARNMRKYAFVEKAVMLMLEKEKEVQNV